MIIVDNKFGNTEQIHKRQHKKNQQEYQARHTYHVLVIHAMLKTLHLSTSIDQSTSSLLIGIHMLGGELNEIFHRFVHQHILSL